MPADQGPQNVIWIFGDQHRAQALGYMGDPNLATPHIDRLASEGVTFSNAVAGCPWCTPFRGSLLTSFTSTMPCSTRRSASILTCRW